MFTTRPRKEITVETSAKMINCVKNEIVVISINKEKTGVPNAGQPFNYFIYKEGGRTVLLRFF